MSTTTKISRKLRLILCFAIIGWPLWSLAQNAAFFGSNGIVAIWSFLQDPTLSCSLGTSCTITVSATTAGSGMAVGSLTGNATHITSVTGGGGTWSLCGSSACNYSPNGGSNGTLDAAYNVSGTGGATSITVNLNTTPTGFLAVFFFEVKKSTGPPALDTTAVSAFTASCATCSAAAFTLSGRNDAFVQFIQSADTTGSSMSSFPYVTGTGGNLMYALNTNLAAAPTMTQSPAGVFFTTALAFK